MRTKNILLGAAVLAAGVASSMAANVYSVNVVGYVNANLVSGYNLFSNPLDVDGTNNVNTVFPNVPDGTQLLQWGGSGFKPTQQYFAGSGWFDLNSLTTSTNNLPKGQSFFLYNPSTTTPVTFVGNVVQGTNTVQVVPGYNFMATVAPIASDLDTNGFPQTIDGLQYSTFTNGQYTLAYQYFLGSGWYDTGLNQVFPTPGIAQGFLIYNPTGSSANWTQTFTVQ